MSRPATRFASARAAFRGLLAALLVASAPAAAEVAKAAEVPDHAGELLARAKEAAGGAAWDRVRTITTEARVESSGLSGTVSSVEDALSGHYGNAWKLGPASGGDGFDGTAGWSVEASGQVIRNTSGESYAGAIQRAYLTARAYWFPERRAGKLSSLGDRTESGRSFLGILATPDGGRAVELWFDAKTLLLDYTIETVGGETQRTSFSDYRKVEGLSLPFAVRTGNGHEKYDTVIAVTSIAIDAAVDEARFAPPAERTGDFELADGRTQASVPFRMANNHLFVQAEINGQGKFNLFFDTGGVNAITPETAQALGLSTVGNLEGRGVGEKSEDVAIAQVESVRLGGLVFRDQLFYVFPIGEMSRVEGVPVSGIIGYELLKRLVAEIDYDGGLLTFTLPAAFTPPHDAAAIPFTFDSETPEVAGTIDGLPGRFTIDTGSRSTLDLNAPFVAQHKLLEKHPKAVEATTGWGVGGAARSRVARMGRIVLGEGPAGTGSVAMDDPVVGFSLQKKGALAQPHLAGNVGGGLLRRFDVTFDYGRQVMYLVPNGNAAKRDAYDRAGLWLLTDPDGLRIKDVTPGSPAAKAGLKAEELIVSVDGKKATDLVLSDLRLRLANDPVGSRVVLTVRSKDGKDRPLTVVLADQI